MKIESAVIHRVFTPPFETPIADSTLGPFTDFPFGLLEIHASGDYGSGIVPVSSIAQSLAEEVFFPLLWEHEVDEIESVERYWELARRRIRNMGTGLTLQVLNGIDTALWDLVCKLKQKPLYRALGGTRNSILAYATTGWVNYDLPKLISDLEKTVARGFSILKMKVGVDRGTNIAEDVRRVKAVRKALGSEIQIAVDANQCWSVDEALQFAREIADADVLWFEEPTAARDFLGYQRLQRECPIPIAAGETLCEADEYRTFLALGCTSIVQPYDNTVGGITPFRRIAAIAAQAKIKLTTGGFSPLNCSLLAAAPSGYVMEFALPPLDTFCSALERRPEIVNGEFLLLEEPGHGVRFSEDAIRRYAKGDPVKLAPGAPVRVAVF